MAFKIQTKNKLTFTHEEEEITLHIERLSAKKEMLFSLKVARLSELYNSGENKANEELAELYETYAELLADITFDVEGIDRDDLPGGKWSEDKEVRKQLFVDCGIEFLTAAVEAYNASKQVPVAKKK